MLFSAMARNNTNHFIKQNPRLKLKNRKSPQLGFFFQAEDGIRDHCVPGVQTCALPILPLRCRCRVRRRRRSAALRRPNRARAPWMLRGVSFDPPLEGDELNLGQQAMLRAVSRCAQRRRSEERRVGKECRSRWAPNDDKE